MRTMIYIPDQNTLDSVRKAAGEKSVSSYLLGLHKANLKSFKRAPKTQVSKNELYESVRQIDSITKRLLTKKRPMATLKGG